MIFSPITYSRASCGRPRLATLVAAFLGLLCLCRVATSSAEMPPSLSVERIAKDPTGRLRFEGPEDIIVDRNGFLWLVGDLGLIRYDGTRAWRFGEGDNGLGSDLNLALLEGPDGNLWVATGQGVTRFDPRTEKMRLWRHEPQNPQSLNHNYVSSLALGADDSVLVGTYGGAARISADGATVQRLEFPGFEHLEDAAVRSIMEDTRGRVWIGFQSQGIGVLSPLDQSFRLIPLAAATRGQFDQLAIETLFEDRQGNIWLGTMGAGVLFTDNGGQSFTHHHPDLTSGLQSAFIYAIHQDRAGNIWLGTDKGGVSRYHPGSGRFVAHRHNPFDEHSLLSDTVRSIATDAFGNVWFASFPYGLNRYHPVSDTIRRWQHNPVDPQSLTHSAVLTLHLQDSRTLWAGTENGLNRIDLEAGTVERVPYRRGQQTGLPAPAVTAVATTENRLWVGTWSGGLASSENAGDSFVHYSRSGRNAGAGARIWSLLADSSGQLLIGTEAYGLKVHQPGATTFTTHSPDPQDPDALHGSYVLSLDEREDGTYWVGTQEGLNLYQPATGQFEYVTANNSQVLDGSRIKAVVEISPGQLWLATQAAGLVHLDTQTKQATVLGLAEGLPSVYVSALELDSRGQLWVSTSDGIARIDPDRKVVTGVLYGSDGLAGADSNRAASTQTPDGRLFFGSTGGVTSFDPQSITLPPAEPHIVFSGLNVAGRRVAPGDATAIAAQQVQYLSELVLPPEVDDFTILLANNNTTFADKTQYSHRLLGHRDGWSQASYTSELTYSEIPPGRYLLQVRAKTRHGQWSPDVRELPVVLRPHFWQTTEAYGLYLLGVLLLLALIYRLILLRLLTARLNREVAEKTEALRLANENKSKFLANVSHELRTPLNAIIGFSRRILKNYSSELDERAQNALESINRNGEHLNKLVNDILDLSKLESGKMGIDLKPVDANAIVAQCLADFQPAAQEKGLKLTGPKTPAPRLVEADPQRLTQILYNLLSNAVKYTDSGEVSVRLDESSLAGVACCAITVADTGRGISQQDQRKLFTRFEQVDSQTKYLPGFGTGLGLALVEEFTRLHHGRVTLQSEMGQGSRFTVLIPFATRADKQRHNPD